MIKVLLADDHSIVRAGLRRIVEESGDMEVVAEAGDGREAIQLVAKTAPDVAVIDISMPGLDGLELQELLKHHGILIPIVFLTGHGDIPMSVRAIKAGATDFLTKPVDAAVLVQAVSSALTDAKTRQDSIAETAVLADRVARLTPRELEVMKHVARGQLTKQIAPTSGPGNRISNNTGPMS